MTEKIEIDLDVVLGICPFMSGMDLISCTGYNCEIFDSVMGCCSFKNKTLVVNEYEQAAVSRFKDRLKTNIEILLNEKTGWGRVEVKNRLFNLIDGLKDESSL